MVRNWFSSKVLAPVAALALIVGFSSVTTRGSADDKAAATGSIAGSVVDKDGNPAKGVKVALMKPPARGEGQGRPGRGGDAAPKVAEGDKPAAPADRPRRPEPVATTTTDDAGKFSFKDVAAGDYAVVAGERGVGMGREKVTVEAGKEATVALTLKVPAAGGDKPKAPKAAKAAKAAK